MIEFWHRFDELVKQRGLTNKEVYASARVTATTFSTWRTRGTVPPAQKLLLMAKILQTRLDYLITGEEGDVPILVNNGGIPLLSQQASCGNGVEWNNEINIKGLITVPVSLMAKKPLGGIEALGSSMLGVGIENGDVIIFSEVDENPPSDNLYVFALNGDMLCKRLEFDGNSLKIFSVRYKDLDKAELVTQLDTTDPAFNDNFKMVGKVIGWMHMHS